MCYHSVYGSYFYICALTVRSNEKLFRPHESFLTSTHVEGILNCGTCKKCAEACPTKAVCPKNGVTIEKCIREHMTDGFKRNPEIGKLAGNRVFGCNICQLVCPFNTKIPQGPYPAYLTNALEEYFENNYTPLEELLGKNIAKPDFFQPLLDNARGNVKGKIDKG
jgi:epoxyqueuosine reductase QueG